MCGIFGMIGKNAVNNTLTALKLLEYRGYDSAGIAANRGSRLDVYKTEGRIAALVDLVAKVEETDIAIGHTRWATHGTVCTANAHPFLSKDGRFAIVHNGIIENYRELKHALPDVRFSSQTDSEVVAHLLAREYRDDVFETVLTVAKLLKGSFAIAVTCTETRKLYAIKNKSPLVVGMSENGIYLCSDVRCLSRYASRVAVAPDNTVVELSAENVRFYDLSGNEKEIHFFTVDKFDEAETAEGDFMLKEIFEIPAKLRLAKKGYIKSGGLQLDATAVNKIKRVYLIGCGTAYNSGLQAAAVARKWLNLDIMPVVAGEFIYDSFPVDENTLALFISQSGETADTVRAAERVRDRGGRTYAVTNTSSSSLTFVCENTVNIFAGSEYAVASTKAYNCQLVVLTMLLADIARMRGTLSEMQHGKLLSELDEVPDAVQYILDNCFAIADIAEQIKRCSSVFYIGRTVDYPTACEGSLKLKEISYIHSEAYPAGELKHGTLALMEPSVAVVAISTDAELTDKMASSITEVTSRGAKVISVAPYKFKDATPVLLPDLGPSVGGILSVVPLQLLAYYTAKGLGRDVDKPRHLAKSVTVE